MAQFRTNVRLAWLCILPQLLVTLLFFIWPAGKAIFQSFFYNDAFGVYRQFAKFGQYANLFKDPAYLSAVKVTVIMVFSITLITMVLGLIMALLVKARNNSHMVYKPLLLWPYAVAPAVAAILWRLLCHPTLGWVSNALSYVGVDFNYAVNPKQALCLIIMVASWQQFSYNFLFYFAALKGIPQSILDASCIDGASSWRRFWQIIFPLLSPTTFFLLIMNTIYSFFDTFGIIQIITNGGPAHSTVNLMYKVYQDAFIAMDFGGSSAQSVVLLVVVSALTLLHFFYLEKKVFYQ